MQEERVNKQRADTPRKITIDFLYVDLSVCERCIGTDQNLESALSEVAGILESSGVEVALRKTLVESEEQAKALGFFSSPTIRINGHDIALELRESRCSSCESCSCNGTVNCRVWVFQGKEYLEAPKGLIIDSILREVYGGGHGVRRTKPSDQVPENLRRFFAGKAKKDRAASDNPSCCGEEEQTVCCEPSEKAACCGETHDQGCGCK
jgi:hypothetical protein